MGNDLRDLTGCDAVVQRQVQIQRQLDDLITRDQGAEGDDAAIAASQVRTLPEVATQGCLPVPRESGRHLLQIGHTA